MIRNADEVLANGRTAEFKGMREDALQIFTASIEAVDAAQALQQHLLRQDDTLHMDGVTVALEEVDTIRALAFGKASLPMARALVNVVDVDEGLVVTHEGEAVPPAKFDLIQAGHPHPTDESLHAGKRALKLAEAGGANDLLFVLVSGGGSSLLEATDLSLEDLRDTVTIAADSGMDVVRLNTVRKHLSTVKGGQLARIATGGGSRVLGLIVSDVVGDPLSFIASGPTVADESTFADAKTILETFGVWSAIPRLARKRIDAGVDGDLADTPKPGEPFFDHVHNRLIARNRTACEAAVTEAERRGYQGLVLTSQLQGEAREVGRVLAAIGTSVGAEGLPLQPPAAIVTGGETTVRVRGPGQGGRSQELVLAATRDLRGQRVVLLSGGTDGRDGETDAAGALADGDSWDRAQALGLDPADYLATNDAHTFFQRLKDTIVTGPTGTNVMDVQILLVR